MQPKLSFGAIAKFRAGETGFQPVVQLVDLRQMVPPPPKDQANPAPPTNNVIRFKGLAYDGADAFSVMFATQLNHFFISNEVKQFDVIRIDNFNVTQPQPQTDKLLVILAFTFLYHLDEPLGNPTPSAHPSHPSMPTYGQASSVQQTSFGNNMNNSVPSTNNMNNPYGNKPAVSNNSNNPYTNNSVQNQNFNMNVSNSPPTGNPYNNMNQSPKPFQNQNPTSSNAHQGSYGNNMNPYGSNNSMNNNNSNNYNNSSVGNGPYGANNNRAVMRDDNSPANILPISAINPYSNKWTIKARITNKSDLRRWSNARGDGTLFSIDLLDSYGTEIRATFFKEACDKFYPVLEASKVYTFSGGKLKLVDKTKNFNTLKNNYELTFDATSIIQPVLDDVAIKTVQYHFIRLDALYNVDANAIIDIIGIVRSASEVQSLISQKMGGKELFKRDLTIADDSGNEVRLTLWGDKATNESYPWHESPIALFKTVKVGDYGGRSLSAISGTSIVINPTVEEAHRLNQWRMQFTNGVIPVGIAMSVNAAGGSSGTSLEKRKPFTIIKDENLGFKEKADFIEVKGIVNYIKHDNDPWYTSCITCKKKVISTMSNTWNCEKCGKAYDECQRRYILSMTMCDHSGQSWLSLFDDQATLLLGHTAEELYQMRNMGDNQSYEKVFQDALFKAYTATIRVKSEMVNDEPRVKCSVQNMDIVDPVAESRLILDALRKY
eukprot:gene11312-15174_t